MLIATKGTKISFLYLKTPSISSSFGARLQAAEVKIQKNNKTQIIKLGSFAASFTAPSFRPMTDKRVARREKRSANDVLKGSTNIMQPQE